MSAGENKPKYDKFTVSKGLYYLENYYDECEDAVPSVAGLAEFLNVSRPTLYSWAKTHTDFAAIMDRILTQQERVLVNKGLSNEYNPSIVKLMLGKHGYHEKSDMNIGGQEGNPLKLDTTIEPSEAYLKMLGK